MAPAGHDWQELVPLDVFEGSPGGVDADGGNVGVDQLRQSLGQGRLHLIQVEARQTREGQMVLASPKQTEQSAQLRLEPGTVRPRVSGAN